MNKKFKSYTTQTAFSLSLSQAQIKIILLARDHDIDGIIEVTTHGVTLRSLKKKGLINPRSLELTKEGELLASLLVSAGFEL